MEPMRLLLLLSVLVGSCHAQNLTFDLDGRYQSDPYPYGEIRGRLGYEDDRFSAGLSGQYNTDGQWRTGLDLGYKYDDRLSFNGNGWVDSTRDWGVGVGLSYRFKRSVKKIEGTFHLSIKTSECNFAVYDINKDSFITRNEVHVVFADEVLAEKLFKALDITTGDEVITVDEFYFMAPKIIYGCQKKGNTQPIASQKSSSDDKGVDVIDEPAKLAEDDIEN